MPSRKHAACDVLIARRTTHRGALQAKLATVDSYGDEPRARRAHAESRRPNRISGYLQREPRPAHTAVAQQRSAVILMRRRTAEKHVILFQERLASYVVAEMCPPVFSS